MKIKSWLKSVVITLCVIGLAAPAYAKKGDNLVDVKTAWVAGQESFPVWFAKKQGWDKEKGMNFVTTFYGSGNEALEDFAVNNWSLGGLGAIPTLKGAANGNMLVIGLANDESKANSVMVRPGSPILAKKGIASSYPAIYGSAVDIRKKSFIVTPLSSSHYTLVKYLDVLGVSPKEVNVKYLDQALGLLSFEHAKADAAVFWAPYTFMANGKGYVTAAIAHDVGAHLPIYLVANKAFTEQYPEITKNFLAVYMRGIHWLLDAPRDEAVKQMQAYYKEVFGLDYSETMLDLNFNVFEIFDFAKQKELFAAKDNGMSVVQKWQESIAHFVLEYGSVQKGLQKNILGSKYVVSTFINMIEESDLK